MPCFSRGQCKKFQTSAAAAMLRDSKFHPINPTHIKYLCAKAVSFFPLDIEIIRFCDVIFAPLLY
jgi:hypothetical protein